jgi:hypothetical protein
MTDLAAALSPRLIHWIARETPPRYVLVYGDAMRQTIYLSRRVLRAMTTRAHHPVSLVTVPPSGATGATDEPVGPVAQLARYQADALLAVAARMALDTSSASGRSGNAPLCYAVTAPRSTAEAHTLLTGVLGRILAFHRAPETVYTHLMTAHLPHEMLHELLPPLTPLAPAATGDVGDTGPLTLG